MVNNTTVSTHCVDICGGDTSVVFRCLILLFLKQTIVDCELS